MDTLLETLERPIIIVSSRVGRGNWSVGEAIKQKYFAAQDVKHIIIENDLPSTVVSEDLRRYSFLVQYMPFVFHLIYRIPFFYWRKFVREKYFIKRDLKKLRDKIAYLGAKTVICVSHRPAFWMTVLKKNDDLKISLVGILTEFGWSYGWQYLFWEHMDGFISPVERHHIAFDFPQRCFFMHTMIPAHAEFDELSQHKADMNKILIVGGIIQQRRICDIIENIIEALPQVTLYVMCRENKILYESLSRRYGYLGNVKLLREIRSIVQYVKECSIVITKPGMSTLLELHAAQRKIFLFRGIPVSEDHNAQFAIDNFNAEWFSIEALKAYREDHQKL
jgi:glycosyltransferase involved in cell wall biosynthesis